MLFGLNMLKRGAGASLDGCVRHLPECLAATYAIASEATKKLSDSHKGLYDLRV